MYLWARLVKNPGLGWISKQFNYQSIWYQDYLLWCQWPVTWSLGGYPPSMARHCWVMAYGLRQCQTCLCLCWRLHGQNDWSHLREHPSSSCLLIVKVRLEGLGRKTVYHLCLQLKPGAPKESDFPKVKQGRDGFSPGCRPSCGLPDPPATT